jgi:hypothetical protein
MANHTLTTIFILLQKFIFFIVHFLGYKKNRETCLKMTKKERVVGRYRFWPKKIYFIIKWFYLTREVSWYSLIFNLHDMVVLDLGGFINLGWFFFNFVLDYFIWVNDHKK